MWSILLIRSRAAHISDRGEIKKIREVYVRSHTKREWVHPLYFHAHSSYISITDQIVSAAEFERGHNLRILNKDFKRPDDQMIEEIKEKRRADPGRLMRNNRVDTTDSLEVIFSEFSWNFVKISAVFLYIELFVWKIQKKFRIKSKNKIKIKNSDNMKNWFATGDC